VDASSGVDVVGPARLRVEAGAVVLEQGSAVADARAATATATRRELVTAAARTSGADAEWRVEVKGDRTIVTVVRGEVSVLPADAGGPGAERTLRAGERVEVARAAAPSAAKSDAPAAPPPVAPSAPTAPPNGLRLALGELLDAPDDRAAFDAAQELSERAMTARERVAIWRRYLTRVRPSPSVDVAMAELANALVDVGSLVEAKAVVDALTARPPAPQAEAALDRARGRLLSRAATECLAHDLRAVCPPKD
jgi:hypothetical protein